MTPQMERVQRALDGARAALDRYDMPPYDRFDMYPSDSVGDLRRAVEHLLDAVVALCALHQDPRAGRVGPVSLPYTEPQGDDPVNLSPTPTPAPTIVEGVVIEHWVTTGSEYGDFDYFDVSAGARGDNAIQDTLRGLIGKRVRVTLEVLDAE